MKFSRKVYKFRSEIAKKMFNRGNAEQFSYGAGNIMMPLASTTTTSRTKHCPSCLYPIRVRFVLQPETRTWAMSYFYDAGKPDKSEIRKCPVCGYDLHQPNPATKPLASGA